MDSIEYKIIEKQVLSKLASSNLDDYDIIEYAKEEFKTVDGYIKTNIQAAIERQLEYCKMYNSSLKLDDIITTLYHLRLEDESINNESEEEEL
jgi:hypothetical protein